MNKAIMMAAAVTAAVAAGEEKPKDVKPDFRISMPTPDVWLKNWEDYTNTLLHPLDVNRKYPASMEAKVAMNGDWPYFVVNGKPLLTWNAVNYRAHPQGIPHPGMFSSEMTTVYVEFRAWWPKGDEFDPTVFDYVAEMYMREQPGKYLMWDITLYPPNDWAEANPDEMCRDDHGEVTKDYRKGTNFSYASKKAKELLTRKMEQAIRYLESAPYANMIAGYRINSGHTIEWLGWSEEHGRATDFSPAMRAAFGHEIPGEAARTERERGDGMLWTPAKHREVIEARKLQSELIADFAADMCRRAKELTGGKKLIGTYYGYTMTLNSSGWGMMRGHYALERFLKRAKGAVDFLMSPQPYGIRKLGDICGEMKPFATIASKGIVPVIEDDTRTHAGAKDKHGGFGQTFTEEQSREMLRRNMATAICRMQPVYLYALKSGTEFAFPSMWIDSQRAELAARFALERGYGRHAKVAIVTGENAILTAPKLTIKKDALMLEEKAWRYDENGKAQKSNTYGNMLPEEAYGRDLKLYGQMGATVDYVLAEDLGNAQGYDLYVFQNAWVYDDAFLKAVKELQAKGKTLFWLYAPGWAVADGSAGVGNMKRLTGFDFAEVAGPIYPRVTDGKMTWGMGERKIQPMFTVDAGGVDEVLGRYDGGEVGAAMKRAGGGRSFFSGAHLPSLELLRRILREAGIHSYSEDGDPTETSDCFVMQHARSAGRKTIRLPKAADVVDVYSGEMIGTCIKEFSYDAEMYETRFFYYGNGAETLSKALRGIYWGQKKY